MQFNLNISSMQSNPNIPWIVIYTQNNVQSLLAHVIIGRLYPSGNPKPKTQGNDPISHVFAAAN